jgi:predicted nucleotidyltransferase
MYIDEKYPLLHFNNDTDSLEYLALNKLAWKVANKASVILKNEFNANRVVLFGSVIDPTCFDSNSDIDLAVAGIPDERFYAAVAAIMDQIIEFKVDIIDLNDCKDYLRKEIEKVGIEL